MPRVIAIAVAVFANTFTASVSAQTYPDKPIRLVIPFAPAGTTSILGRYIAQHLGPLYGQQIIVDNRPGAGGHVGAELVARAPADGYTLVMGTIGIHAAYSIYQKLTYDPAKELHPVAVMVELPCVVVTHPSLPTRNIKELIALARSRPGEINFGSAGAGSATHMTGELFKLMAKVNLTHIPYRGSAPALQDVVGGQIQAMFEQVPTTLPMIEAGRLRTLAVTGKGRVAKLPNVPTVDESGVPGYESTSWFTVAAPVKVPRPIIQKLNTDLNAMLATREVQARFEELGITRVGGSPEDAAKHFARETEKWSGVIKTAGIRAD